MKKMMGGLLMGFACTQPLFAADLLDVINLAHRNDPTFQQAQDVYRANVETLSQARSGLFPILQGNASRSIYNDTVNSTSAGTRSVQHIKSRNYSVTVTQPLVNLGSWVEVRRSHQVVNQAEATVRASELDLFIRAANAYFAVLAAKDTVRFAEAEKSANARELDQVQQRFKVGLEAITSVYDAQARYDAVVSREIAARNDVSNKLEALREITSTLDTQLAPLQDKIPLTPPNPSNVDEWVNTAKARNFDIIAKHFAAETARYDVKAQHAAFTPKLNLVGEHSESQGGRFFGTATNSVTDVSLQVTSPIFQGSNLFSRTRQSRANYAAALSNFDATEKAVISATRQAYNNIITGISAVRADQQAVKSAQSSMESSEAAYRVGTRTIVDVLDSQQVLFNNQRQLSADLYAYIRAILELKRQAGTLNIRDIVEINSWLREPAEHNVVASTPTEKKPIETTSKKTDCANPERIKSS